MPFEKCYGDKKDFKTEATSSKGVNKGSNRQPVNLVFESRHFPGSF